MVLKWYVPSKIGVKQLLGIGIGYVYVAYCEALHRLVADCCAHEKMPSAERMRRFEADEADVARRLTKPCESEGYLSGS